MANLNAAVDPGKDFFEYANGGWLARNPIPASESAWGIGNAVDEQLNVSLRRINEKAAATRNAPGSDQQKIGDFWATAMDTAKADKLGAHPLDAELARIDAVHNAHDALNVAFEKVGRLIGELRAAGHVITLADLGGGLGVPYDRDMPLPPTPEAYGAMVQRITAEWNVRLIFEPGRLIVANAGVLLSEVIRVKPGVTDPFVIVDAAMNDLMRPSLYDAYHAIDPVEPSGAGMIANVVGPVCETGDTFATGRRMGAVEAGDLVVFRTAGAYAATMASTYNSRPLTPEVMVSGADFAVIRQRQDIAALIEADTLPPWLGKRAVDVAA